VALHKLAPPRPPKPDFSRLIPVAVSPQKGHVKIQFYVPKDYEDRKRRKGKKYPIVVNFHGGGFTLGTATDDARWAGAVTAQAGAIVASVDYRLAPEYHFPTAVEDGVDAVLYIARHAEELWVDVDKIAVSGFSAGGNMAFTVPLRLQEELEVEPDPKEGQGMTENMDGPALETAIEAHINRRKSMGIHPTDKHKPKSHDRSRSIYAAENTIAGLNGGTTYSRNKGNTTADVKMIQQTRIAAIVAWYPSTDYTLNRDERRKTNLNPDHELSATFTELFDASYLQPPSIDMANPYLSPSQAPGNMLTKLPDDIVLYTCEWDMLREEGQKFKDKLEAMGKRVYHRMVLGVPHGWDKAPNPLKTTPGVAEHYSDACRELRRVFGGSPEFAKWDDKKRGSVWNRGQMV
jgi:acetyl esterase/lipase